GVLVGGGDQPGQRRLGLARGSFVLRLVADAIGGHTDVPGEERRAGGHVGGRQRPVELLGGRVQLAVGGGQLVQPLLALEHQQSAHRPDNQAQRHQPDQHRPQHLGGAALASMWGPGRGLLLALCVRSLVDRTGCSRWGGHGHARISFLLGVSVSPVGHRPLPSPYPCRSRKRSPAHCPRRNGYGAQSFFVVISGPGWCCSVKPNGRTISSHSPLFFSAASAALNALTNSVSCLRNASPPTPALTPGGTNGLVLLSPASGCCLSRSPTVVSS